MCECVNNAASLRDGYTVKCTNGSRPELRLRDSKGRERNVCGVHKACKVFVDLVAVESSSPKTSPPVHAQARVQARVQAHVQARPPVSKAAAMAAATASKPAAVRAPGLPSYVIKPADPLINETLLRIDPTQQYVHRIVDHGGGGHCGYQSFAAGINNINQLRGNPVRYTQQDMREIVAEYIEQRASYDQLNGLGTKFYDLSPELDASQLEASFSALDKFRVTFARSTRDKRWANEFDLTVLSQRFGVGIILFRHTDGSLYPFAQDYIGLSHYILMYHGAYSRSHTGNHYQTVELKHAAAPDSAYTDVFVCESMPSVLVQLVRLTGNGLFSC